MFWARKKKLKAEPEFDCCSDPQLKGVDPSDKLGWCMFQCQSCKACWDMDFGGWSRDTTAENMLAFDMGHKFPLFTKDFNRCEHCDLSLHIHPAIACANRTGNSRKKEKLILRRRHTAATVRIQKLEQEMKEIMDDLEK